MLLGRRDFLKQVSVVAAADIKSPTLSPPTPDLNLTFACGLYDRMLPLYRGDVRPEGINLKFEAIDEPRQLFDRMGGHLEFEVSEFSISEFVTRVGAGNTQLVGIPVFPSRVFRHGYICVNRQSGIRSPKDLVGRKIGVEIYTETASVYIRGFLQHEYQVDPSTIHWIQGAIEKPGAWGHPNVPPLNTKVSIENNVSDQSLSQLLESRQIDAVMGANLPSSLNHNPDIVRLFPNFKETEKEFYKRTHIFPIMHLVVIRRDVYEQHPWVASSLYKAFNKSRDLALQRMHSFGALAYMLPWLSSYVAETDEVFSGDPWPYGLEPNRATLTAFSTYMVDQGMTANRVSVDSLFVPVDA